MLALDYILMFPKRVNIEVIVESGPSEDLPTSAVSTHVAVLKIAAVYLRAYLFVIRLTSHHGKCIPVTLDYH
jgi:hypothetical protein